MNRSLRRNNIVLWRYYMHGILDADAKPIALEDLIYFDHNTTQWLVPNKISNSVKESNLSAVKLQGRETKNLGKPILTIEDLERFRGQKIRFYIWMKGENCGQDTELLSGAPRVCFYVRDGLGNLVDTEYGRFKTRGTFPWFCYHIEFVLPDIIDFSKSEKEEEKSSDDTMLDSLLATTLGHPAGTPGTSTIPAGSGLFLGLENPANGTVYFSTLSWEMVTQDNTYEQKEWIDPQTGSKAPNSDYDELPMHVIYGLAGTANLNFLKGNHTIPNLLTTQGLNEYFSKREKDPFHLLHGIPFLNYLAQTGEILELIPKLDKEWYQILLQHLESLQNPETGLWGRDLLITNVIVKNNFAPVSYKRQNSPQRNTPWMSVLNASIPHRELLLATLLKLQLKTKDKTCAGWNLYTLLPDDVKKLADTSESHLSTTTAAVELLALLKTQMNDPKQVAKIQRVIVEAREYVLSHYFFRNFLWKQNENSTKVTSGMFMFNLLEASGWQEDEVLEKAPAYEVAPIFNADGGLSLNVKTQPDDCVSLRILAAPAKIKMTDLTEKNIVGIIEKDPRNLLSMDPFHALIVICNAAEKQWEITPASEGAQFLAEKLEGHYPKIVYGVGLKEITIPLPVFKDEKETKKIDTSNMSAEEIENMKAQEVVDNLNKELSEEEVAANKIVYYSQIVCVDGRVTAPKKIEQVEIPLGY